MAKTEFTEWLWSALWDWNWSQAELSRKTKLAPATISRLLNGQRAPSIETCKKLADVFCIPQDIILQKSGYIKKVELNGTEDLAELINIYQTLNSIDKKDLLSIARNRITLRKRKK